MKGKKLGVQLVFCTHTDPKSKHVVAEHKDADKTKQ